MFPWSQRNVLFTFRSVFTNFKFLIISVCIIITLESTLFLPISILTFVIAPGKEESLEKWLRKEKILSSYKGLILYLVDENIPNYYIKCALLLFIKAMKINCIFIFWANRLCFGNFFIIFSYLYRFLSQFFF